MGARCCAGKQKYPHLFEPIRIGNIRLKNRIIAAPTSPSMMTTEGHFTPEMIAYLEEKAKGGAAVVTYGEAIVHSATGKSHNKQLQLDSFGVREGLAIATRKIHNAGAYANIQLSHGGKWGGLASVGGTYGAKTEAWGVSDEDTPVGHVKEMPKEMILEIVKSYGTAAKLCQDCGFDMVQVHAAHGWLFSQFLSPVENKRTDESLHNQPLLFHYDSLLNIYCDNLHHLSGLGLSGIAVISSIFGALDIKENTKSLKQKAKEEILR